MHSPRSSLLVSFLAALPALAFSQGGGPGSAEGRAQSPAAGGLSVPRAQLPPTVQSALKSFENQFELALAQDCPSERCFSRGCTYVSHETVDRARNASLPGLGEPESAPGAAGPAQEYLTAARCEFAYENTLPAKDIATLVKRLEQKLARGYTTLDVEARPLPALPATLRQTPAPPAEAPDAQSTPTALATPDALAHALTPSPADANPKWLRELWKALLPHVSWMIAILLGTTAVLVVIWALRRLGRQSPEELAEEKALLAALEDGTPKGDDATDAQEATEKDSVGDAPSEQESELEHASDVGRGAQAASQAGFDDAHARLHRGPSSDAILRAYGTPGVWKARMQAEPGVFEGVVRRWLREKDFSAIAKLALGSQEEFRRVLPSGEEFALERAELAEYMAHLQPGDLPSDEAFAAILSSAIVASYVSDQGDDELVNLARLLREQFGPEGFAALVQASSDRLGAVLFAIIPAWRQTETAQLLAVEKRVALVGSLAERPRASHQEVTAALRLVQGAVDGGHPPHPARGTAVNPEASGSAALPAAQGGVSHGRDLQAGQALSALLPLLPREARRAFVKAERERFHGAVPPWTEGLFYPEMLSVLDPSVRAGLFLRLDARDIALWLMGLSPDLRRKLQADFPGALGTAVQSYLVGGLKSSPAETRAARERVRTALAEAMRAEVLGGRVPLDEAV